MLVLSNIEFYRTPNGEVMISDENGLATYTEEKRKFTEAFYSLMEDRYPDALAALAKEYAASRANLICYQYRIVHRFIRCNLSVYDTKKDIDHLGDINLEEVQCPLRHHECKLFNVVCNPRFNTNLSIRQSETMRLLAEGYKIEKVADMMGISPETARTHRRDAYRKLRISSLPEYMLLINKTRSL